MNSRTSFQILLFLSFLIFSNSLFSQYESRGDKYNYKDAESFYNDGNYYDALPLYDLLIQQKPNVVEFQMKVGICHLNLNQTPDKAIDYLKGVYDINPKTLNVQFYLAKAYALNYKFSQAIEFYEMALKSSSTTPILKKRIPHLLEQSKNAEKLVKDSLSVEIINLGQPINSTGNEYSPIISEDELTLMFTYRGVKSVGGRLSSTNTPKENGNFNEDILISKQILNTWTDPKSISDSINSVLNEGGISLSPDGNKLYLYKDTKAASGDIFESVKDGDNWTTPKRLSINSRFWEGHATVSPNGNKIIFSSNRPGGLGGKDLYSATLKEDGSWGPATNLGPTINTIYDEDAPFLQANGEVFNFSSEGHSSMGGYDIFESKIIGDSTYSTPKNMGYPINTTSNDVFYVVLGNENVYYSSARRGGYGQNDIYLINVNGINISGIAKLYKDPSSPIVRLRVNITDKDRTFNLADTTDSAGRYNFSKLPNNDEYILFIDEIDEKEIDDSMYVLEGAVTKMGRAFTKTKINGKPTDDAGKYRLEIENVKLVEINPLAGMSEKEILTEYGAKTAPGLIYKVQVAAMNSAQNFEGKHLKAFGEMEVIVLDDGISRLMIGKHKTLQGATEMLEKAKASGQDDAFIIVFVDGKRTYLEQLVKEDAFDK